MRIGGPAFAVCGMAASVSFAVMWIVAASVSGCWNFGQNSLSDLGVCGNPTSEILFNLFCVGTGFAGMYFGYGIFSRETGWLKLCGITTILSSILTACIGVITERYDIHMIVAGAYGVCICSSMILSGMGDFLTENRPYTWLSLVLLLVCGFMNLTQDFPMFECVAMICILTWIFMQGLKYHMAEKREMAPDDRIIRKL